MKRKNRLAKETSPYLLLHAENPVDWYPWGKEALELAKKENKPIFLSIGYSACHWCHVMERESFESEEIAGILNRYFVSVKVDREELPGVDDSYMKFVIAVYGQGGWPLSVFLTRDGEPFTGGTYFPSQQFKQLLLKIAGAWKANSKQIKENAQEIISQLQQVYCVRKTGQTLSEDILDRAAEEFSSAFDEEYGGFHKAPKFPRGFETGFLFRRFLRKQDSRALNMALFTLQKMALGGINDQLGGGFHRYSTDEKWLVPHFEKMLYDNALLAQAYARAYRITKDEFYKSFSQSTIAFVLREMSDGKGGFHCAYDADSEGVEGKYYIWTKQEVREVLKEHELVCEFFGVEEEGNFEQANVLHVPKPPEEFAKEKGLKLEELERTIQNAKVKLLERRKKRSAPSRDDKVVVEWNSLMISALCEAYNAFGEREYLERAAKCARFIIETMAKNERLKRSYSGGKVHHEAVLSDYALMIQALLDLYETTFDIAWFDYALKLTIKAVEMFWDEKDGAFFDFPKASALFMKTKDPYDGATPSGNSVMATNLLRLYHFTLNEEFKKKAQTTFDVFAAQLEQRPMAYPCMLSAIDFARGKVIEVVMVVKESPEEAVNFISILNEKFLPDKVVAVVKEKDVLKLEERMGILAGRKLLGGRAAVYLCENNTCKQPVTKPDEFEKMLQSYAPGLSG